MNFPQAVRSGFRNYWRSEHRASRSEFWYWFLFTHLASVPLVAFDYYVLHQAQVGATNVVFSILTFPPTLFMQARRLHDTDRSYKWMFVAATIIGFIPLFYWNCCKGTKGVNRFGDAPVD